MGLNMEVYIQGGPRVAEPPQLWGGGKEGRKDMELSLSDSRGHCWRPGSCTQAAPLLQQSPGHRTSREGGPGRRTCGDLAARLALRKEVGVQEHARAAVADEQVVWHVVLGQALAGLAHHARKLQRRGEGREREREGWGAGTEVATGR